MIGKILFARNSQKAVKLLQSIRFQTQPLVASLSTTATGATGGNAGGKNNGKSREASSDLWQKIKSGVSGADKKFDGKNNSARRNHQSNNKPEQRKRREGSEVSAGDNSQGNPHEPRRPRQPREGSAPGSNNNQPPRRPRTHSPNYKGKAGNNTRPRSASPRTGSQSTFKPAFRQRRPASPRSDNDSEAGSEFNDRRRRSNRRGDSDDSVESSTGSPVDRPRSFEIAEADSALLFDDDFFVDKIRKDGGRWVVDDEEADFMDHLLSRAYLESIHTSDNSFKELYTAPGFDSRFKLPRTRSLHQLRCALEPKIKAAPDSLGYSYALQAWTVLQRSNYYSDRQKRQIANGIATMVNDITAKSKEMDLSSNFDESSSPDYYYGPPETTEEVVETAEEVEQRHQRDAVEAAERAKVNAAAEEVWDNDTAVDEDELEGMDSGKK